MHRAAITMVAICGLAIGCRPHHAIPSVSEAAPPSEAEATPQTVIAVDNAKLAAFGLDMVRVQNALIASGIPVKPDEAGTFVVTAPREVDAIAETIVGTVNGAPIRVSTIAQIQRRMKRL